MVATDNSIGRTTEEMARRFDENPDCHPVLVAQSGAEKLMPENQP